ncbi:MAG TPA: peptidylprolyl isomerase [Acidimicrobiales bacterium]|nr:peptidylprolyl isomerase [Acidimicrobiales bacterium]
MPSEKRARQREAREKKLAELRKVEQRRKTTRRGVFLLLGAGLLVLVIYLVFGTGSPAAAKKGGHSTTTTTQPGPTTTTFPTPVTQPLTTKAVAPVCPPTTAAGAASRVTDFTKAPGMCIDVKDTYAVTFETDVGSFTMTMKASANPQAVNNFVFLARYHFYDGTKFHRVIPKFVDQGGDPTGTGTGGPGYSWTGNVPPSSCKAKGDCYPDYSVAMANSGTSSSNGSQFFIVVPGGGSGLGDLYTEFANVTAGQSVVDKINSLGSSAGVPPDITVYILHVTVTQSAA